MQSSSVSTVPSAVPLLVSILCASIAGFVDAAPRGFYDARSIGMARTGISAPSQLGAVFLNPALLATPNKGAGRTTALLLPSFNASAAMDDDLTDNIDSFQDGNRWDRFVDSVDVFNATNDSASEAEIRAALGNAINAAGAVDDSLRKIDREALQARLGFGTALSRSGDGELGYAMFASTKIEFNGIARYNDSDIVNGVIDTAQAILDAADTNQTDGLRSDLARPDADPASNASVLGIAIAEFGIALAHNFELEGLDLQLGLAPKIQHVRTFDYTANTESFDQDDFDRDQSEEAETVFNIDLGLNAQLQKLPDLSIGLVVRNLVPHDFDTASGKTMELNPLVQTGVAWSAEQFVVSAEIDLTRTEAVGFEGDRQLVAVGGEFSPLNWLHLRAGVSHNLRNGEAEGGDIDQSTLGSLGLGFTPGNAAIDIAGVIGDSSQGVALQFGYLF